MKRRISFIILAAFIISLLAVGCGGQENASDGSKVNGAGDKASDKPVKDTLIIAYADEPETLDCQGSTNNQVERMSANIFATLVKFNDKYEVSPYIAKSWDVSEDGLTYTFHLRDDVYFHDGDKMTAKDVEYSFNRAWKSEFVSGFCTTFESVKAVDDYTFQIVLKAPNASLLNSLCAPQLGIMNEEDVTAAGDNFAQKPIGSGPYKVVEWVKDEKIVLEAHDKFFEGEPPIKTIEVRNIPDPSTKLISLENGEVDVVESISTSDRETIMDNKALSFQETESCRYAYLGFNNQSDTFKNQKLRQAISYAIDKKAVIDIALDGIAAPAKCTVSSNCFGYPEDLEEYEHDPEKAKALLAESGFKGNGFDILCRTGEPQKVAQAIQADLKDIGIDVTISMLEVGAYYDKLFKGDFDTFIGTWSDSLYDPGQIVEPRYGKYYLGTANVIWLDDAKVDNWISEGIQELDKTKRKAIYHELFQYVKDQAFEVPLFFYVYNIGTNKDLKNVKVSPTGIYHFNQWSW